MTALTWDGSGKRKFETGVDHGALYPHGGDGVAWNGLTNVTETPGGADNNKTYADNIVYGALRAAETFGGTVEAYTCPDEFLECDGFVIRNGVVVGQQSRKGFDLYYRTIVGNDQNPELGHKHHFVYGATTSPSEKSYATVNDSPEMTAFSWEFECSPVAFEAAENLDLKPTAILTIDDTSPLVDTAKLQDLLDIALGTVSDEPRMPTPDEVLEVFSTGLTLVSLTSFANQPSYNNSTHVATLPSVTGVIWLVDGEETAPGALAALTSGESITIEAQADTGYNLTGDDEWTFSFS
jgi:hypothetical protein